MEEARGRDPLEGLGTLRDDMQVTLERKGVLQDVRAQLRVAVLQELEGGDVSRPPLSHESLVCNELVRDYLLRCHLHRALSVFLPEAGQPAEPLDRTFLARQLGVDVVDDDPSVPLLYSLVARLMKRYATGEGRRSQQQQQQQQQEEDNDSGPAVCVIRNG